MTTLDIHVCTQCQSLSAVSRGISCSLVYIVVFTYVDSDRLRVSS